MKIERLCYTWYYPNWGFKPFQKIEVCSATNLLRKSIQTKKCAKCMEGMDFNAYKYKNKRDIPSCTYKHGIKVVSDTMRPL